MITNTSDSFNQDRRRFINKPRIAPAIVLQTGGAEPAETIPFVFAVMSNLSGSALSKQPGLEKRQLHRVLDRNEFNKLFEVFKPEFDQLVKNRIAPSEGEDLKVKLNFKSMKDFTPEEIVQQVPILLKLLNRRNSLVAVRDAVGADAAKKTAMVSPDLKKAIEST
jgi:type VI secretion system protein ImpB